MNRCPARRPRACATRSWPALVVVGALGLARPAHTGAQSDSTWRDHARAARAAAAAHHDTAALDHMRRALVLLRGNPDAVFEVARLEARVGEADSAVDHLRQLAAEGLVYDTDTVTAFAALRSRPDFAAVMARFAANRRPVVHATRVYALSDTNALSEDIAYDRETRTFFVSSVHRRSIVAIHPDGSIRPFVRPGQDPDVWSVFALAADPGRHALWATTAALPVGEGYAARDSGRSALLRYDLSTARLVHRYELPRDGRPHVLGDIALDSTGAVIVCDGLSGGVYVLRRDRDTLELLVPPGVFNSPQTPARTPDGRILVPDYGYGIGIVDPATGAVTWMAHPDSVTLVGIDGMYLVGHVLLAVENGTSPPRVVRCALDAPMRAVISCQPIERGTPTLGDPTHGVVVGRDFYYIANSGWNRFADDGTIAHVAGAAPPIIMRASLGPAPD